MERHAITTLRKIIQHFREDAKKEFLESKKELTWRLRPDQQPGAFATKFKLFMAEDESPDGKVKESVLGRTSKPFNFSLSAAKKYYKTMTERAERLSQVFMNERHEVLGNDLAAAHFIVFRGGKVKFVDGPWVEMLDELTMTSPVPTRYDPNFLVEAMDCEGVNLYFEGIENLRRLKNLLCISFRNNKNFDDWCLDRVSGSKFEKIQVLDLAGTNITFRGLHAIYRMPSLKKVIVDDPLRDPEWQLTVAMLNDIMPDLEVVDSKKILKIPGFPLHSLNEKQ